MFDKVINLIAPHLCYGCHIKGALLCDSCIYNITEEKYERCIVCLKPSGNGICGTCCQSHDFSKAWVVGERKDELKILLNSLKFERCYEAAAISASLLHSAVALLPPETVVVAVSTIPKHRRLRGYDHAELIAKQFAHKRKLSYKSILKRQGHTVQLGANATKRKQQAAKAFYSNSKLDPNVPYLVIDDIVTTTSTIQSAARALRKQGAENIWVTAVAHQPLR